MASSSATLKLAAACMLLLCVASDLTRPAMASSPLPWTDQDTKSAVRALVRELVDDDLAELLGLQGQRSGNVGDICSQACQTCLIVCAITCVVVAEPIACFSNCTVSSSCFAKAVASSPLGGVPA